jgi:hypothetical protein
MWTYLVSVARGEVDAVWVVGVEKCEWGGCRLG